MIIKYILEAILLGVIMNSTFNTEDRGFLTKDVRPLQEYPHQLQEIETQLSDSEMEEIAEELQKQIDQLRKQIKDILTQLANTSSEEVISILQKELDDLNTKLEDSYKKLDKLSSELQQEFRQKLDELAEQLANANTKILQRLLQLEQEVQNRTISLCIGNLRDGLINTAIASFKHIKNPKEHITHIINESYQSDANCESIVDFVKDFEIDGNDQTLQKEIKVIAYYLSDEIFSKSNFASKLDSTCRLKLAWNANNLVEELDYFERKSYDRLFRNFPKSINKFIYLYNNIELVDENSQYSSCLVNEVVGNMIVLDGYLNNWWPRTSDGKWFMIPVSLGTGTAYGNRPMISFSKRGEPSDSRVVLAQDKYTNLTHEDKALWRVVPVSNERFYLESKKNPNEFLTPVSNFFPRRCNNLTLRDVPYHFFI